jgi:hypothetical protein
MPVKDVDRGSNQLIRPDRQHMLNPAHGLQRRIIDIGDLKIVQFAQHDVDRHVFDHLTKGGIRQIALSRPEKVLL